MVKSARKLNKSKHNPAFILGLVFLFTGFWLYFTTSQTQNLPISVGQKIAVTANTDTTPELLYFPKLNKSVAVTTGYISLGRWFVDQHQATYLDISAKPGQPDNIVIYGHNKPQIFGILSQLNQGDAVMLKTENQNIHRYVIISKMVVNPEDITIAYPTNSEMLTLYTCTGLFDSKRLVLKAIPKI